MIVLGRIAAPHGVRGWVRVRTFGDDPAAWARMARWWLGADEDWKPFRLVEFRVQADGGLAKLEGIDDRDRASSLRGLYVAAPREELPAAAPDECYWADLIGLPVFDLAGEPLGEVARMIDASAHPVLALHDANGVERLVPFVAPIVREVDLEDGRIVVDWGTHW